MAWDHYAISVICSCVTCGILSSFFSESAMKPLIKVLCSLFLIISVIVPFSNLDISELFFPAFEEMIDTEVILSHGEAIAREEAEKRIKENCEAYILNKAKQLGGNIMVAIQLNEESIPAFAEIEGEYTEDIRRQLEISLESELGIAKENQQWTGKKEKGSS
ncbi:MAG: hypothetical protein II313_05865 [Anaerotignum sp.]|nr:hypothetical protein [Anaerotignum sp.]